MDTIKNIRIVLALLLVLVVGSDAYAKWEVPITSSKVYGFNHPTNLPTASDINFYNNIQPNLGWQNSFNNQQVINRVVLGIDKSITSIYHTAFTIKVDVTVNWWDENNVQGATLNRQLVITYDPAANTTENNISILEFEGALKIDVAITNIYDVNNNIIPNVPNNVYLESFIQVNRYELLDPNIPSGVGLSYVPGEYEERTIIINSIPGAESYDVEWLFIDKYSGVEYGPNPTLTEFEYNFRHDGTRLTTTTNSINIPVIYQEGIILIRVRANGVTDLSNTNVFEAGVWSMPQSGELYMNFGNPSNDIYTDPTLAVTNQGFYYDGYQQNLNWQRNASFAEEGKHKQAISYFDGILRDRQSITKNNTENLPIVGQRIYDFVGRPAIEILPVPDPDDLTMQLRVGFNLSADPTRAGKTYNYKDFDIDAINFCVHSRTSRMDNISGASKYYSSNNSLVATSINKNLIPDAQEYPFIQTEYTADNTGRVARQGSVGKEHRLTGEDETGTINTGHETVFSYQSPTQEELDRLFANEIGDAVHYKKHVVVDANGQQSVSYIDPQGRVIATALIGNPSNSPNLLSLDNVDTRTINANLIRKNFVLATERSIVTYYHFYVPDDNTQYAFDYSVTSPYLKDDCLPIEFCFDCIYDLELSIKNTNCDIEYVPVNDRKVTVGTIDSICGDSIKFQTNSFDYLLSLSKGNYFVSKKLTINKEALEYYKQQFLNNNSCLLTKDDFKAQEAAKIDFENCYYTCEKCNDDLEAMRIANGWLYTDQVYLDAKVGCDELCDVKTPCFALNEMMTIDMSPGGQYFNNINNTTRTIDPDAANPFSLTDDFTWLDANINSTQKSQIFADILSDFGVSIANWTELQEKWSPEYAEYLIPYHPEYCYYQECGALKDSYLYDDDMLSIEDWTEAKTKGYYNPLAMNLTGFSLSYGSDYISNITDPFFDMAYNASRKTAMEGDLTEYINDVGYTDPENSAWKAMELAMAELGTRHCFNNYSWAAFRAMYLSEKQKYYKDYFESKCTVTIPNNFTRRFIFDDIQAKGAAGGDSRFDHVQLTNPTSVSNAINTEAASHCSDICNDYADRWMAKLANCVFVDSIADSATIRNHFVEICKKGCDADNFYGSRSIKPTENYQFKNFKEVLEYYGYFVEGLCDDLLIGWPMNYGHDYYAYLSPEADTCACDTNKNIRQTYCPVTGPALNDSCLCGDSATTPGKQALLGTGIDNDYKCKNCIDCYTINEQLRKFFDIYPHQWAYTNETVFNNLLKNYLNVNLSMNLDLADYALFASECLEEDSIGYDSTSFYRLSQFNYIYRPGSVYIPRYTMLTSPFPSDIRYANDNITKFPSITLDNTDKSTWLVSTSWSINGYLTNKKAHGPNAAQESPFKYSAQLKINNVNKIAAPQSFGLDCNCEEIMRAHALWKTGRVRASSAQMAYQVINGVTWDDFDDKLKQCCYMYNGTPPYTDQSPNWPDCSFDEELFLEERQNQVPFVLNTSGYSLPAQGELADEPCPEEESECHNQKVTLDRCGCEFLMILKDRLAGSYASYSEQDIRNLIEQEFGLDPGSLPVDFNPKDLTDNWCEDFYESGAGEGTPYSVIPNSPAPPTQTIDWFINGGNNTGLDDLEETAYDEELEIPRILSCHPYCDREIGPPAGGGGGGEITHPKVILPEPEKCKYPSCSELINYYKDFLDSVGIPHGGSNPPLLPTELSSEFAYFNFMREYQKDKANTNFPIFSAWQPYFTGGTTTASMIEQLNNSITTKLIADGYCDIENERPYKQPTETYSYFVKLFGCLQPQNFNETECSLCVKTNDTLKKIQLWFNRIAKDDLGIMHRNNKPYMTGTPSVDVPQFYNEFYGGGMPQNIYQNIWTAKIPMLNYHIDEGSTVMDVTLQFPRYIEEKYNWRYLKYFYDIEVILDENCNPTNMFKMKARLHLAQRYRDGNPNCLNVNSPCDEEVVIRGYIDIPSNLIASNYTQVPCPPCKTLCNKPYLLEPDTTDPCELALSGIAEDNAEYRYQQYIKEELAKFEAAYIAKCLAPFETFTMNYTDYEYQYTLYYYDQADNLIKTVPPKGVNPLSPAQVPQAIAHRDDPIANPRIVPNHSFITNYKYNTLNQTIEQTTPDGGTSKFWYDKLGRIVLSQDAKQAAAPLVNGEELYSYVEYDELNRIFESGEVRINPASATPNNVAENISSLLTNNQTTKTQITRTIYDNPNVTYTSGMPTNFVQENTRNHIVHNIFMETWNSGNNTFQHATHYTYDMRGNVKQVVQDFPELDEYGSQYKMTEYEYDLASGNVHMVLYQPTDITGGNAPHTDRFYHYYVYDADNKLKDVYTSRRPAVEHLDFRQNRPNISTTTGWTRDAKYMYYSHGRRARYEIGEEKVQGVDYAYTMMGWLKSINSGIISPDYDPGADGKISAIPNGLVGRDAFGLELGYYTNDYIAIGSANNISIKTGSDIGTANVDLFNGNISHTVTSIPNIAQWQTGTLTADASAKLYRYDQLNRIKTSRYYNNFNLSTNDWNRGMGVPNQYYTGYSYDPNGNILTLRRNGNNATLNMDQMTYNYINGTNKLEYVGDPVSSSNYTVDIDNQNPNNYEYDDIGNLIRDDAEEIATIEWTAYRKIKKIIRVGTSTKPDLEFEYNAQGQRVCKRIIPKNTTDGSTSYYYIRGVGDEILAVYKSDDKETGPYRTSKLYQEEINIYGTDRIGIADETILMSEITYTPIPGGGKNILSTIINSWQGDDVYNLVLGYKKYELKNQLGNVQVVVTDRKLAQTSGLQIDYYNPDVVTIRDYYAFGMLMPDKNWKASNNYRFGFNGQESNDEIAGNGDYYSFEYRVHDARLGRFLSVDPLFASYPWNSTYAFAENRVIDGIDLEGLENQTIHLPPNYKPVLYQVNMGHHNKGQGPLILSIKESELNTEKQTHYSINETIYNDNYFSQLFSLFVEELAVMRWTESVIERKITSSHRVINTKEDLGYDIMETKQVDVVTTVNLDRNGNITSIKRITRRTTILSKITSTSTDPKTGEVTYHYDGSSSSATTVTETEDIDLSERLSDNLQQLSATQEASVLEASSRNKILTARAMALVEKNIKDVMLNAP